MIFPIKKEIAVGQHLGILLLKIQVSITLLAHYCILLWQVGNAYFSPRIIHFKDINFSPRSAVISLGKYYSSQWVCSYVDIVLL